MLAAVLPELAFSPDRKRWTREEAQKISELFPLARYELIQGELIDKMGQNPPHALVIAILTELLSRAFPGRVRIQSSIGLPEPDCHYSEPEPDVVLLRRNVREFSDRHPGPDDIALLIEVADSTLDTDRSVKSRLYARAGIAEYWIIDIPNRRTFVCRRPAGDEYLSVEILASGEPLEPLAGGPDHPLTLDSLLP